MNNAETQLAQLHKMLLEMEHQLHTAIRWSDEECCDQELGTDMDAIRHYLDCLNGRISSARDRVREISRRIQKENEKV